MKEVLEKVLTDKDARDASTLTSIAVKNASGPMIPWLS